MLNGVIDWFKNTISNKEVDVIKKSELMVGMNNLKTVLEENIIPSIDKLDELMGDGTIDVSEVSKAIKLVGFKNPPKTRADVTAGFNKWYNNLLTGVNDINELIEDYIPNVLVTDALTIRQSAILTLANNMDSCVGYLSELIMFIAYELNGDKAVIYPKFNSRVTSDFQNFAVMMDTFDVKKNGNVYDRVSNLSDVKINVDKSILRETATDYDLKFNIPANNFNGDPFYFLGKWWVDFELKRAARYRDMKRLTEYKLIQLKEKQEQGNESTSIAKQIEFYENRVKKYDAKIRKLEE